MYTIQKHSLQTNGEPTTIITHYGAQVLSVHFQHNQPMVSMLVNLDYYDKGQRMVFTIYATDEKMMEHPGTWAGSYQAAQNIWHVFYDCFRTNE